MPNGFKFLLAYVIITASDSIFFMDFLFIIIGLIVLVKSADWLVDGAAAIAKIFGVSNLVIGLTVVAFGTSAPELIVNLISVWQGSTQLAIGNIIGSNIANILLILGISSMIYPLVVKSNTVWKEIPYALLAALMVAILANDIFLDGAAFSVLSRIDGFVLLGFFAIFMYYTYGISKNGEADDLLVKKIPLSRSLAFLVSGLGGLIIGGKLLVDGAVGVAMFFGVGEALIGLTIVAIGTSLPELATSAVAAFKKQTDIAIGNIVGSNIFNTFLILAISAVIKPLPILGANNFNFFVSILASVILFAALFVGRKHALERWQGLILLVMYIAYVSVLIYYTATISV